MVSDDFTGFYSFFYWFLFVFVFFGILLGFPRFRRSSQRIDIDVLDR